MVTLTGAAVFNATANLLSSTKKPTTRTTRTIIPIFSSPFHLRLRHRAQSTFTQRLPSPSRCSNSSFGDQDSGSVISRPPVIPWNKNIANTVHLIGTVGSSVQIKHLPSGKSFAWTRLAVRKSATATDATWINLSFWDALAESAFKYVEEGQRIYVCGRLVSDVVESEDEKRQVFYKIVVSELNFIEKNVPPANLYSSDPNSTTSRTPGPKLERYDANKDSSVEERWQAFFSNPLEWWDNRATKTNPNYPDFKHKDTKEALWVTSKYNPPWVTSELALLDSKLDSMRANQTGSSGGLSVMSANDLNFQQR